MQLFLTKSVSLDFFVFKTQKLSLCEHFKKHKDIIENGSFSITRGFQFICGNNLNYKEINEENSCSGDT